MSEVVISGYYGFGNAGDEAMLSAIIENLTDIDAGLKITVISGNPEITKKRHGVEAVYRLNYPRIIQAIKKSDLLLSGGGSLLQDVTSDRSLYYYLSIMLLAKKLGKPAMLYAQGIGPVQGSAAQAAVRYVGNMTDLITVRDEGSFQEIKRLNVTNPPVYVTADPVLATHRADKSIGRGILRRYGAEGTAPLIGISAREWKEWSHYKNVLAQVADTLAGEFGAKIVFLPMQYPEDAAAARKIIDRMHNRQAAVALQENYTTTELLSLVGNFDFLIGVRLHALIFAAVMQVPMAGISYDPKIDRFLETLGERHVGTLKTITVENLLSCVRQQLTKPQENADARTERINALRAKAFQSAELAVELIEKNKHDAGVTGKS